MGTTTVSRLDGSEGRAIRQWAEDHQAASMVEARKCVGAGDTPSQSFRTALTLLTLHAGMHGWPPPDDPIDQRDNLEVWNRFARLRAKLRP